MALGLAGSPLLQPEAIDCQKRWHIGGSLVAHMPKAARPLAWPRAACPPGSATKSCPDRGTNWCSRQ